jgi:hypothetical protein
VTLLAIGLFLVFLFVVILLPVKLAAGWAGAERTGFGSCFIAVVLALVINALAGSVIKYGAFVSIFVTAIAYMLVLGTTYLRGVLIAVLEIVILYGFAILFAGALFASSVTKLFGLPGH